MKCVAEGRAVRTWLFYEGVAEGRTVRTWLYGRACLKRPAYQLCIRTVVKLFLSLKSFLTPSLNEKGRAPTIKRHNFHLTYS